MKLRSTLMGMISAVLAATAIVACGSSGGGGGSPALPVTPVTPAVIPPGTVVGFFAQNTKMDSMFLNQGSSYTAGAGMYDVLKTAMRTCDRAAATGGYTGGSTGCQAFLNGFQDIMIFANGSQASTVKMVMRAMPDTSCQNPYYCSNYWYDVPSFQQLILGLFGFNTFNNSYVYNPMIINMTIWPINNSQGFELRGYAPGNDLYYNSGGLLFQFQVAQGKLEDLGWDYQLVFNGKIAATGHMVRCSTQNCGVSGY